MRYLSLKQLVKYSHTPLAVLAPTYRLNNPFVQHLTPLIICLSQAFPRPRIMARIQDIRIHAPLVYAEGVIFIVVCSLMVFLRVYARRITKSSLGMDDLTIVLGLVSFASCNMHLGSPFSPESLRSSSLQCR